jgi:hypothetical protein
LNAANRHFRNAQREGINAISTARQVLPELGEESADAQVNFAELMKLKRAEMQKKIMAEFPNTDPKVKQMGSARVLVELYTAMHAAQNGGPEVDIQVFIEGDEAACTEEGQAEEACATRAMGQRMVQEGKALIKNNGGAAPTAHTAGPQRDIAGQASYSINSPQFLANDNVNALFAPYFDSPILDTLGIANAVKGKAKPHVLFNYDGDNVVSRTPGMMRHGQVVSSKGHLVKIKRWGDAHPRSYNVSEIAKSGGLQVLSPEAAKEADEAMSTLTAKATRKAARKAAKQRAAEADVDKKSSDSPRSGLYASEDDDTPPNEPGQASTAPPDDSETYGAPNEPGQASTAPPSTATTDEPSVAQLQEMMDDKSIVVPSQNGKPLHGFARENALESAMKKARTKGV